jgi:GNAT superfamily N-acetyltransferase
MKTIVKELSISDKRAIEIHLIALSPYARRLRFGSELNYFAIRSYVDSIDFSTDAVFGVVDDDLALIAVAHLARDDDCAELGLSIFEAYGNRGIGTELFRRASIHARNWNSRTLFMHTLTQNAAMMYITRKQGMRIVVNASEADAWFTLAPADKLSREGETAEQSIAVMDYALKRSRKMERNVEKSEALLLSTAV